MNTLEDKVSGILNDMVFQSLKENVSGILNDICLFGDCELGRIIGLRETEEDYYYISKTLHGKRVLISCVGSVFSLKSCLPEDHYNNMDAIYAANNAGKVEEIVLEYNSVSSESIGNRMLDMAVSGRYPLPDTASLRNLWASELKEDQPAIYQSALSRVFNGVAQVDLVYNTEIGEPLWSLVDTSKDDAFWMESFSSKEHALNFIKGVGWDLRNIVGPEGVQQHKQHKMTI